MSQIISPALAQYCSDNKIPTPKGCISQIDYQQPSVILQSTPITALDGTGDTTLSIFSHPSFTFPTSPVCSAKDPWKNRNVASVSTEPGICSKTNTHSLSKRRHESTCLVPSPVKRLKDTISQASCQSTEGPLMITDSIAEQDASKYSTLLEGVDAAESKHSSVTDSDLDVFGTSDCSTLS